MDRRTSIFSRALIFVLLALSATAFATVPSYINYQGVLTDAVGNPVATSQSVVFTIYDAATLGSILWTETRNVTPDADGRFFVILGQAVPIADTVFRTPPCWLGTKVSSDPELTPRTLLSSVPYTYRVSTLDGATGGDVVGQVTILTDGTGEGAGIRDPGGNIGNYTPTAAVFVDSVGDRTVSYGIDGITISVNNAVLKDALNDTIFHVDADDTTLTLGSRSSALGQGAVAIGDSCTSEGDYATIAGGRRNRIHVYSNNGFIGAGRSNMISDDLVDCVVVGGFGNQCLGDRGFVGAGQSNVVSADEGVVPGGFDNEAGERSFAAGTQAKATHSGAFVWADNSALDFASTANNQFLIRASGGVGLGTTSTPSQLNLYENSNSSQALFSEGLTQGGLNIVTDYADDFYTPGVFWSTQNDQSSKPKAGVYVFTTSTGTRLHFGTSNNYALGLTNDAIVIDQQGEIGLGVKNPSNPLQLESGARCTAGGVWTNASDANLKENFQQIAPSEILQKVATLPITQWNYRNEDPSITHIGPTAQDFLATFGVGGDDKSISTIDPSGIALAAIQALNEKLNEQKSENEELRAQIAELREMIRAQATQPK